MKAMRPRTYSATASQAAAGQRWYLIDAEGQVLGRVATTVANILRGKGKPTFTPHMDGGDFVIVINADKIVTTGAKETQKNYYRHSNFPGGLKTTPLKVMRQKHPERILEAAVKGMLPKNPLGARVYLHMKVYAGPNHPHEAQKPERLELPTRGDKRGQVVGGLPSTPAGTAAASGRGTVATLRAAKPAEAQAPVAAVVEADEVAATDEKALPAGAVWAADDTCPASHPIKGNNSSSGEFIYHVPGGSFYERTHPEVCFATEDEAQAAGYRASKA